ncbi:hypothetical protein [Roseiconus lacunae]|uniref:hypothetical protein n=1 Tax=Roseiconus lacunae TaxID=2605694 RepID=UPI0011F35437|nr:hypothetical protein [Roseiconus lacunae]
MFVPPIVIYIVAASFLTGILLPLVLGAWGQRGRPGVMLGVFGGSLLSVPTGLLSGSILWSLLEETSLMPEVVAMVVGPLVGCFVGTFVLTLIMREAAVWIAANRKHSRDVPNNHPTSTAGQSN